MNDFILIHHGVKGQKWGVRRYQNPDGSLTPEGEKRYYNADGSLTKHGKRARRSSRLLPIKAQLEHLEKLHNSKSKKPDDPNVDYWDYRISKGQKYVKSLSKQLMDGLVTSFTEDAKGKITWGKTKKGVVVRDKDGNRVTHRDYGEAQRRVYKILGYRVHTGMWE